MRVFLPLGLADVLDLAARGVREEPSCLVHAVTPALSEALPGSTEEELEFAAMVAAGDAALRALADGDAPAPWRRAVLALEVPADEVSPAGPDAEVSAAVLTGPLRWQTVAAVMVDDPGADPDLRRAAADGDPDLADRHDLQWYGVQELDRLAR